MIENHLHLSACFFHPIFTFPHDCTIHRPYVMPFLCLPPAHHRGTGVCTTCSGRMRRLSARRTSQSTSTCGTRGSRACSSWWRRRPQWNRGRNTPLITNGNREPVQICTCSPKRLIFFLGFHIYPFPRNCIRWCKLFGHFTSEQWRRPLAPKNPPAQLSGRLPSRC